MPILAPRLPEFRVIGGQAGGLHSAVHPVGAQVEIQLELLIHGPLLLPPRAGEQVPARYRGRDDHGQQPAQQDDEGHLLAQGGGMFLHSGFLLLSKYPAVSGGVFVYSTFRPSRFRKDSMRQAISAARWAVSISQNTRSSGSVPEKRQNTQPPPWKYTLQPSA